MQVLETINETRTFLNKAKKDNLRISIVPTMGFLHAGHLSLIDAARKRSEIVVVSIFLNPTQFNDPKDLEKYPKDLERDLAFLRAKDVDLAFCPQPAEIYKSEVETWVSVDKLSSVHEGEFRPGHFRGVTTVVNILFNIVQPQIAFFGEKDFQQLALIRKMVEELHMPIEIVGCPTIREDDGLAMSSRNARLPAEQRAKAPVLFKGLQSGVNKFRGGIFQSTEIEAAVKAVISTVPEVIIEYVRVINPKTFEQPRVASKGDRIILAAWLSGIRLIDNIEL